MSRRAESKNRAGERLADVIVRRRLARWLAPMALVVGIILAVGVGPAEHAKSALDDLPDNSGSRQAAQLEEQLPRDSESAAVILWTSPDGEDLTRPQTSQLKAATARIGRKFAAGPTPPPIVSRDATAAISIIPLRVTSASLNADRVENLRADARRLAPPGVESAVTGPAAIEADLASVFDGANTQLLMATALVVALLLLITYRSPILWLIPLLTVAVADRVAAMAGTHLLAAVGIPWNESTVGILSVLVFGAGTDYALLLISRYRDELRHFDDRFDAMRIALAQTFHAVLASATTVVTGLLTLLLSLVPTTRALGLACAVGIVVAAVFALTVLPAALVSFDRWIFWPRVPRANPSAVDTGGLWHRISGLVRARPALLLALAAVVLVVPAVNVSQIEVGLTATEQFLEQPESIAAGKRLAKSFDAGSTDPARVLTRDPQGPLMAALRQSKAVDSVRPIGQDDGTTRLDVGLASPPGTRAAERDVARLRQDLRDFKRTYIGGTDAAALDEREAASRDRQIILPLIVLVVLLSLILVLRSLAAPLILVATVLATYLAALGIGWWIFENVFGFAAIDVGVPLMAFLFLVALGVDYNIFLVTRAAEEAQTHGVRDGMLRALTATGGVITSAGILLAAVFAVLGVLPLIVLAQLGTVICVGVLLDTLLVRTLVVPAIAMVAGRRFWWPRSFE